MLKAIAPELPVITSETKAELLPDRIVLFSSTTEERPGIFDRYFVIIISRLCLCVVDLADVVRVPLFRPIAS